MSPLNTGSNDPFMSFEIQAEPPPLQGLNFDVKEWRPVDAQGQNIVQAMDREIRGREVVQCIGMVERTNPNDIDSPPKVSSYYNSTLGKDCFRMKLTWEITVKNDDGTEENIKISQDRDTTLALPSVNFSVLQKDYGYRAFLLGTEYGRTISSLYDKNDPKFQEMQNEKHNLLRNDTVRIEIRPSFMNRIDQLLDGVNTNYDIIYKYYSLAHVTWNDGNGKKVKGIDRDYSKETYKINELSRIIRLAPGTKAKKGESFTGEEILQREKTIELDKSRGRFQILHELESTDNAEIIDALKTHNIEESDWIGRLGRKARNLFMGSMEHFGKGYVPASQFSNYVNQINELKEKIQKNDYPNTEKGNEQRVAEKKYLNDMKADYEKLQGRIEEMSRCKSQLEALLPKHDVINFYLNLTEGIKWSPSIIGEKIKDLQALKAELDKVNWSS